MSRVSCLCKGQSQMRSACRKHFHLSALIFSSDMQSTDVAHVRAQRIVSHSSSRRLNGRGINSCIPDRDEGRRHGTRQQNEKLTRSPEGNGQREEERGKLFKIILTRQDATFCPSYGLPPAMQTPPRFADIISSQTMHGSCHVMILRGQLQTKIII